MVDIALDPNMYYMTMSTADTLRKAAELGFRYVELSPNNEFHLWHHYLKADRAFIEDLRKAEKDSGVEVRTLNPVFNWSSPDEAERMAQVRNWRRWPMPSTCATSSRSSPATAIAPAAPSSSGTGRSRS